MPKTLHLANYTILQEFKGNSSNQIYLVADPEGQKLIYKRIRIRKLQSQLREIQAQKALQHDYIVRLLQYEIQEEHIVLLIEYAPGGDLFEFINNIDSIRESKLLRLFYKIVIAVHFIHLNGFIHRDIKPENVLIKSGSPKLADFGSSVSEETARNTFCGTYEYMAPEIYFRQKHTFKVDIWALGVLLFEMTHNRTPFKGLDVMQIKEALEQKKIDFDAQISPKVRSLVYTILKFDAKQRPTTAQILKLPELKRFYKELKPQLLEIYNDKSIQKIRDLRSQIKQRVARPEKNETKRSESKNTQRKARQASTLPPQDKRKHQNSALNKPLANPKPSRIKGKNPPPSNNKYQSNKTAQSFNQLLQNSKKRPNSYLREKTDMNEVLNDSPYTSLEDMCQQAPSPSLGTQNFRISTPLQEKRQPTSTPEVNMNLKSKKLKTTQLKSRAKPRSKTPQTSKTKKSGLKIRPKQLKKDLTGEKILERHYKQNNKIKNYKKSNTHKSSKYDLKKYSKQRSARMGFRALTKNKNSKADRAQNTSINKLNRNDSVRISMNLKQKRREWTSTDKSRSLSKQIASSKAISRGQNELGQYNSGMNDYHFFTPQAKHPKTELLHPRKKKRKLKLKGKPKFVPSPRKLAKNAKNIRPPKTNRKNPPNPLNPSNLQITKKQEALKKLDAKRYSKHATASTQNTQFGFESPQFNFSAAFQQPFNTLAATAPNPIFSLSYDNKKATLKQRNSLLPRQQTPITKNSSSHRPKKGVYSSKNLERFKQESFQTFFGFDQMAYS